MDFNVVPDPIYDLCPPKQNKAMNPSSSCDLSIDRTVNGCKWLKAARKRSLQILRELKQSEMAIGTKRARDNGDTGELGK